MAFNIRKMISDGLKSGVAKTSHFEVLISPPSAFNLDAEEIRNLTYRADSVEIPGRTAMTIDQRFSMNGPVNKVPYAAVHSDVTITFLLSANMGEKVFFEKWMQSMIDTTPQGFGGSFNVKYFDNYKSNVYIRQFDDTGKLRTTIELVDSYPIIMNGVQMGWGDDSLAKLSLQFAHRYYNITTHVEPIAESEEIVVDPRDPNKPVLIGIDQTEASTLSPSDRVFAGLASGQSRQ